MSQDETVWQPICRYACRLNLLRNANGADPKGGYLKKSHYLNLNFTTVLCLLALSLAMTLIAGCSSNSVAPTTENNNQNVADWLDSNLGTGQADCGPGPAMMDKTVSGLIGPKGGVLQVKLDGSLPAVFRFPAEALKVETLITIRASVVGMPSGSVVVYDCGPDGTVFDVPLEVVQPEPNGKSAASLYYFNEKLSQWELQETSPVKDRNALFHIYHFSKYGIS
jgi:hypothetical protein